MSAFLTRRHMLQGSLGAVAAANLPLLAMAQTSARIVIIGGGFGGASAAQTLARLMPAANITLVEANASYTACPFSNLVIGTERALVEQEFSFHGLKSAGIQVVQDRAIDIDPEAQSVALESGQALSYDRLILSPGIQMRWNQIEGYDQAAAQQLVHRLMTRKTCIQAFFQHDHQRFTQCIDHVDRCGVVIGTTTSAGVVIFEHRNVQIPAL